MSTMDDKALDDLDANLRALDSGFGEIAADAITQLRSERDRLRDCVSYYESGTALQAKDAERKRDGEHLDQVEREAEALRKDAEIKRLLAALEASTDSECDKVMAMTDEQIRALSAVQGSSADIDALKTQIAVIKAQRTIAEREAEALRKEVAALRELPMRAEQYDRAEQTERELHRLREFLRGLRSWDMLDVAADGGFWKSAIDAAIVQEGK